jgi:hypothetical protein
MAETYKVLGQSNPVATTLIDVYTVPSGKSAVISTITLCNRSASTALAVRLSIAPAGATDSSEHYIYYDVPINPNDTLSLTAGITVTATDKVRVYTSAATLSMSIFGTEIT